MSGQEFFGYRGYILQNKGEILYDAGCCCIAHFSHPEDTRYFVRCEFPVPYLFLPARAALFIPSTASLGGSRSGSPRPRFMELGPARSNIFLIPDIGMSFILLEICMNRS